MINQIARSERRKTSERAQRLAFATFCSLPSELNQKKSEDRVRVPPTVSKRFAIPVDCRLGAHFKFAFHLR